MKVLSIFLLFQLSIFAQKEYPKNFFRAPLDIPIELSGCFGELRSNHFHSGFDIKTQKTEGLNVFATADGYISRIKISIYGYGKAIYITHPNGYTTVYGHLQKGFGNIEKFIKENQYKENNYEIEIFPKPNDLPVKKGDLIAFSGNTGGSGGPHLHYEIRETSTELILNPMLFGFDTLIKDTKKPTINSLLLYPIDENSVVNQSNYPVAINLALQADGSFLAEEVYAQGKIGFGINTFDTFDKSYNKFGIYKVQVSDNGKNIFGYKFDTFAFEEFRYINAFLDYPRLMNMNQRVQKLFMKDPYPLSIIEKNQSNGIITLDKPNVSEVYKIEVSDYANNKTLISIPIKYSDAKAINISTAIPSKYLVKHSKENIFSKSNAEVIFPENVFYNDFYMDFDVVNDLVKVHDKTIPVHSNFTINIENTKFSETDFDKVFIAVLNKSKPSYIATTRKGKVFTAKTRELGTFTLAKDSINPKIIPSKVVKDKWISDQKMLQFNISDDFSGIKSFEGSLNGKWILLEYEYKNKKLTHNFDDNIVAEGKNDLKLVVTDNVGNSTIFETTFYRSQKK